MWFVANGQLINFNHLKRITRDEEFSVIGIDTADREVFLQSFDNELEADAYIAGLAHRLYRWGMQNGENEEH